MASPGFNPKNLLEGPPQLDPLPDSIDIYTLYRRLFYIGEGTANTDVNWWQHGFVTIQGDGTPPLLMLEAHALVAHRLRESSADSFQVDWVILAQFDDVYSGGPSESIHNPLTGRTTKTPSPFFHPPGTFTVSRKSKSELSLLIERPRIPSYHGQVVAGLLSDDPSRVCLLQTQPQRTISKDGAETRTELTLMLTLALSEVVGGGALPERGLPGRGVFWGAQTGPLNTLFGFQEGACGEFRTIGRLRKGDPDAALVPEVWARFKAHLPDFFDGKGALAPDWEGLFSGKLRGDGLNRRVLRLDDDVDEEEKEGSHVK